MALTLIPTAVDTSAATAIAKAAHDIAVQAAADAKAADERAARAMSKANAATSDAAAAITQYSTLEQVAASYAQALPASVADRQALHDSVAAANARIDDISLTPGPAGATGAQGIQGVTGQAGAKGTTGDQGLRGPSGTDGVQGLAGPTGPAGVAGPVGATGAKGDTGAAGKDGAAGAAGPTGATGSTGLTGPQGVAGSTGATGATGPAGTPADMTRVVALETAVTALQKLKVTVGFGTANLPASLAAGATTNVSVTLSRDMGSTVYSVGYGLAGGTSLLGALTATGVLSQTATTVTIGVKNTGLTSLLNLSTASLSVVTARDA